MKIAQQLLISDKATFEQLTPTEQQLWTTFETADIYRFLTGEEDTVPEFQINWTSVLKLQPLGPTTTSAAPIPASTAPPVAPPAPPLPPASPPTSGSSTSPAMSTPHSSPTRSTSGTRPKQPQPPPAQQPQPPPAQQPQPDPSGASTSGKTPQTQATKAHNLRQRTKVDYKDLIPELRNSEGTNSEKDVQGQEPQWENLWQRSEKCPWLNFSRQFPEICPHHLRPPQNEPGATASGSRSGAHQCEEPRLCKTKTVLKKYWMICGYLNIYSCPDSIQLLPDPGHEINNRATLQRTTRQTRGHSKELPKPWQM
jgi:hypothetical protein